MTKEAMTDHDTTAVPSMIRDESDTTGVSSIVRDDHYVNVGGIVGDNRNEILEARVERLQDELQAARGQILAANDVLDMAGIVSHSTLWNRVEILVEQYNRMPGSLVSACPSSVIEREWVVEERDDLAPDAVGPDLVVRDQGIGLAFSAIGNATEARIDRVTPGAVRVDGESNPALVAFLFRLRGDATQQLRMRITASSGGEVEILRAANALGEQRWEPWTHLARGPVMLRVARLLARGIAIGDLPPIPWPTYSVSKYGALTINLGTIG